MLGRIRWRSHSQRPSRDRPVALHRQPVELDREHHDQHVGQHEHRHREAEHREAITERSIQVPARAAATTPSGTATSTATTSVQASATASARCAARSACVTGRLVKIDVPRSPCSSAPRPSRRSAPGTARRGPSFSRMRRMSSVGGGVAGEDRRRIAGRQVQQREHDERDHRHDDDGRERAGGLRKRTPMTRPGASATSSRRSREVIGAMITPEMFER